MIELTCEQKELVHVLKKWYFKQEKGWFSYSGPPGSGKTTVMETLIAELGLSEEEVISVAYVGKAVMNLIRHNVRAITLHSLIYIPIIVDKEIDGVKVYDDQGNPKRVFEFVKRQCLDPKLKLIFCDEASMLNEKMTIDLLSFGIPVVFVGDKDQLPPVFGISAIMETPDFVLTQIMRQAEGDPIVMLSQRVLHDMPLIYGDYGKSRVVKSVPMEENLLTDYDIILCGKNQSREIFNSHIRNKILRIPDSRPVIRDKIICRQNNPEQMVDDFYLVNGMTGYITNIDYESLTKNKLKIDFSPDFSEKIEFRNILLDYRYLLSNYKERKEYGLSSYNKFEYAYALTVYSAQGSQYEKVLIFDEPFGSYEKRKKQLYTAISRAEESVDIIYNDRWWWSYGR